MSRKKYWTICDWRKLYEPDDSKRRGHRSPLPYTKLYVMGDNKSMDSQGVRAERDAILDSGGFKLWTIWHLLKIAAASKSFFRGIFMDRRHRPASIREICRQIGSTHVTEEDVKKVLSDLQSLRLMEQVDISEVYDTWVENANDKTNAKWVVCWLSDDYEQIKGKTREAAILAHKKEMRQATCSAIPPDAGTCTHPSAPVTGTRTRTRTGTSTENGSTGNRNKNKNENRNGNPASAAASANLPDASASGSGTDNANGHSTGNPDEDPNGPGNDDPAAAGASADPAGGEPPGMETANLDGDPNGHGDGEQEPATEPATATRTTDADDNTDAAGSLETPASSATDPADADAPATRPQDPAAPEGRGEDPLPPGCGVAGDDDGADPPPGDPAEADPGDGDGQGQHARGDPSRFAQQPAIVNDPVAVGCLVYSLIGHNSGKARNGRDRHSEEMAFANRWEDALAAMNTAQLSDEEVAVFAANRLRAAQALARQRSFGDQVAEKGNWADYQVDPEQPNAKERVNQTARARIWMAETKRMTAVHIDKCKESWEEAARGSPKAVE